MTASRPIRLQRLIAVISIVLFAGKLWAWQLTHSVAVLTDALESIVNVIAGFIGLYSVTLAARPRDANHPYGHGKIEYVSAAIEGTMIVAAGLVIIYESIKSLIHPVVLNKLDIGLILIGGAGVVNLLLGKLAKRTGAKERSATLTAAGSHLISDAWSTAAIVIGLTLVYFTEIIWIDSIVAMILALFILWSGLRVIRTSMAGIMDESDEKLLNQVVQILQTSRPPQWIDLHNLRVIQYGDVLHLDAHLTLPWYLQVKNADEEIQALEQLIRDHFGDKVELFVHIDGCQYYQCKLCSVPDCPVRAEPLRERLVWNSHNVLKDSKHGK